MAAQRAPPPKKLTLPIAAVNGRYQRICPDGPIVLACPGFLCSGLLPEEKMPQNHAAMSNGIGHQKPYKYAVQACCCVRRITHLPRAEPPQASEQGHTQGSHAEALHNTGKPLGGAAR